jgi:hypothetical protein
MKKQTVFTLEKTPVSTDGGVKIITVAGKLSGFRCPDSDGLNLQSALSLLESGEQKTITFPFFITIPKSKNNTNKKEPCADDGKQPQPSSAPVQ